MQTVLYERAYVPEGAPQQENRAKEALLRVLGETVYNFQRNHGEVEVFSGFSTRRQRYLEAAREGFNGRYTPEESITRATIFADKLLERAAKQYVAWILAHEYEHSRFALAKRILPFAPAIVSIAIGQPEFAIVLAPLGYLGGAYIDERISYNAGDRHSHDFLPAVRINNQAFTKEIINAQHANS